MPSYTSKTLLSALAGAVSVAAHGHVTNIVINGVSYEGFDPTSFPYNPNPPTVVGWTAGNSDNGFVAPDAFGNGDIICHKSATNAGGHAVVAAGDSIFIQWDTWPESHHGPVIDYLASCGDAGCETVDKTSLEFFKVAEAGLIDGTNAPGFWASDQLIANNNSWMVKIPEGIAPGNYVLRHEIIALHSGGQANGAQNYPQCFNLQQSSSAITGSASAITGSATAPPAGSATAPPAASTTTAGSDAGTTEVPSTPEPTPEPTPSTTTSASGNAPRPTRCPGLKKRRHARDVRAKN
ncbi:glycosyl hydrolase family 61-domain-containing protein [Chaetomium tenue]|uniref:Glycosyl hydrolase family 61-domain-containing protein n=1 Tax=Chaetomium tenue TaxID=1854479 RepID=A0ACB7PKK7_9PEZI|nr:glycosyl hydrolase family 61-domain-containing protein [Chaetomium globosum]